MAVAATLIVTAGCTAARPTVAATTATSPVSVSVSVSAPAPAPVPVSVTTAAAVTTSARPATTATTRAIASAPTTASPTTTSTVAAPVTTTSVSEPVRMVDGLDADRVLTAVVIIAANGQIDKAIAQGYVTQAEVQAALTAIANNTVDRFAK